MNISDLQAENALEYLRINAGKAAKARAEREYMSEYRKTIKANVMKLHLSEPVSAQEREAYASKEYQAHLLALREAIEADEFCRWGMVAASATLDAWRTSQANKRGEQKLG
ncbi:MAG: hypothetical protein NVS3B3_18680 [Aquirhabdus sp.]